MAGNLYTCDASGRPLVRCTIKGENGIIVSGSGTTSDPYRIKANISTETLRVVAGNSGVTVTGPQQHAVATGKLTRSADNPAEVTLPLAEALPPGEYTVAWHVVSVDGHKTKGQYTFSVK